ncbi:MAG: DUF1508 domain-containing protein [Alphaproteobacteria bacterium]|nr:MAG: DUF1508 domain-containing protein [Alphaproteobacteria bacterium]
MAMSDSLDYSLLEIFRQRTRAWCAHEGLSVAADRPRSDEVSASVDCTGLTGTPPWRSIPLRVSNDRSNMVFEIYRVARASGCSGDERKEEWRWRFCTALGDVRAHSGAYKSASECREAIDALRRTAGGARIQQLGEV